MSAENSGITALRPAGGRPFVPGLSGNPGGRPKGLAALVREETLDGRELVAFMLNVLRGRRKGTTLKLRMEAAAWLADRGFGKALQQLELSGPGAEPLVIRVEYDATFEAEGEAK